MLNFVDLRTQRTINCCFLANILMGTIYLFAGKCCYIVLNKAEYEKVVEMSTKQRQCQNNPDVFCYNCDEYMMESTDLMWEILPRELVKPTLA